MLPNPEMQTIAVIPAYNEERTVANVVQASLRAETIDAVVCVNDGSVDETTTAATLAAANEDTTTPFELVVHHQNMGKTEAMQTGVVAAKAIGGDALRTLVFLDADLTTVESRRSPHNRYLHQIIADRLLGRKLIEPDEVETTVIEEKFLETLASHIDQMVKPVHTGDKIMTIGMLSRNRLADGYRIGIDWGMLGGNRAVSLELWDAMFQEFKQRGITVSGWEIEAALNSYTRLRRDEHGVQLNRGIGKLLLTDVVHVGSRPKAGSVVGGVRRMATIQGTAARGFVKYAAKL